MNEKMINDRYDAAVKTAIFAACRELGIPATKEQESQQKLDAEYAEIGKLYENAWKQDGQVTRSDAQTSQVSYWRTRY